MVDEEPLQQIDVNLFFNDDQNIINEVIIGPQQNDGDNHPVPSENKEACDKVSSVGEKVENDPPSHGSSKRAKTINSLEKLRALTHKTKPKLKKNEQRCKHCQQKLNDYKLKLYTGHPNNALDEYSVLIDEKLCLFNGNEETTQNDWWAMNKITLFR